MGAAAIEHRISGLCGMAIIPSEINMSLKYSRRVKCQNVFIASRAHLCYGLP
jgi:hypothetical protein